MLSKKLRRLSNTSLIDEVSKRGKNVAIIENYANISIMKISLIFIALICSIAINAKKYPFTIQDKYEVSIVRVAEQGTKFYKAWGVASSPDKAITQAMQNAVAASLFTGVTGNETGSVPPLCEKGKIAYENNQPYFDDFFKKGDFLNYVKNVNSTYPTGENNISTPDGRKVGIYVQVLYQELRAKLEKDGIIKALNSYF
jgi:hypothetical protein